MQLLGKQFVRAAEFVAAIIVILPLSILPRHFVRPVGKTLGWFFSHIFGRRRKVALHNTRLVFGRKRNDIVLASFKSLGMSLVEISQIWLGRKGVFQGMEYEGLRHYFEAKAAGRPVILITGHLGNWELIGNAVARKGCIFSVVVRPLDNPYLNRMIERIRHMFGNRSISKRGALRDVLKTLRKKGSVAILIDQGVKPSEGIITDFLGRRAYTTKMPALMALKTDAAVIPVFIHRTETSHRIVFSEVMPIVHTGDHDKDVEVNTMNFSRKIAEYVENYPEEWLWIHRRWKRIPENEQN